MEAVTNGSNGFHEVPEPEISNGLSFVGSRELYIRDHAPQILAAMLVRRSSTSPQQMIEEAVSTAAQLYDYIKILRLDA